LEPTNTKAIFRKGVALFNLKSYSSALDTFQNGMSLPLAAAQKTGKVHILIVGPGPIIIIYFRVQKLYREVQRGVEKVVRDR
jgi:Ni,Fe-hydrogenase maturation factor